MKQRIIMHIDMDAFFAAVEQRDNPELVGKPVVIGADPKAGKGRGVVSTCSYEAREYGIHSAQPIAIAYRNCPQAVFLRGSIQKYRDTSKEIFKIIYSFTPDVEPIGIDEAFLDMTGSVHFYGSPKKAAQALKKAIYESVKLKASIGIAPVKMVAKIASDYCKPDGLLEVKPGKVLDFLHPLSIDKLWGVGKQTRKALDRRGIKTIGNLAHYPHENIAKHFGDYGEHLYQLANGIDPREVERSGIVKSVSNEHTFGQDIDDTKELYGTLLKLSEKVSRRLRKKDLKGRTISIKVRRKDFKTFNRSISLGKHTNLVDDIYGQAKNLFDGWYKKGELIRLIGVKVSNFDQADIQELLFEDPKEMKAEKIHVAVDQIKDKFGDRSIHRGL